MIRHRATWSALLCMTTALCLTVTADIAVAARTAILNPSLSERGLLYVEARGKSSSSLHARSGNIGGFTSHGWNPDQYGDYTVWEDYKKKTHTIKVYDASTGRTTRIPESDSGESPAIWGTTVVFTKLRSGRYVLCAYDIASKQTRILDAGGDSPQQPDIYRKTVVYAQNNDIWAVDLDDDDPHPIVRRAGDQCCPAIWGSYVVYSDWDEGLANLWIVDLRSGQDTELVTQGGIQHRASLWDGQLAYEDYPLMPRDSRIVVREIQPSRAGFELSGANEWLPSSLVSVILRPLGSQRPSQSTAIPAEARFWQPLTL